MLEQVNIIVHTSSNMLNVHKVTAFLATQTNNCYVSKSHENISWLYVLYLYMFMFYHYIRGAMYISVSVFH